MVKKTETISTSDIFEILFYRLDKKHQNFCIHDGNIINFVENSISIEAQF